MSERLGYITIGDVVVLLTHRIKAEKRDRFNQEAIVELVDVGFSGITYGSSDTRRFYVRFNDGVGCWVYRSDIELHTRLAKRLADRIILLQRINYALDSRNEELFNELTKQLSEAYYEVN